MCKHVGCSFCADEGPQTDPYFWGTLCILLTRLFFVHQLISSLTKQSNYYGKSTRLGTRNRSIKNRYTTNNAFFTNFPKIRFSHAVHRNLGDQRFLTAYSTYLWHSINPKVPAQAPCALMNLAVLQVALAIVTL